MYISDSDSVDEYECQSCGQLPICLNSTANGHEVCDDCLPLFAADEDLACPLPVCEIPSHMADKISAIKENLERNNCGEKNAIEERYFNELKELKTEVGESIRDMRTEISNKMRIDLKTTDDLESKMEALTMKLEALERKSSQLQEKSNEQLQVYQRLSEKSDKRSEENYSDLKENLKKVENDLQKLRSSLKLNKKKKKDHSLPQLDSSSMNSFNLLTRLAQFKPAFSWKIKKIKNKMERHTYEQRSDSFRWPGYPVTAKAKLESKANGLVHLSVVLEDVGAAEEMDRKLIPRVYFVLKSPNSSNHAIRGNNYLFSTKFSLDNSYLLDLAQKTWLTRKAYNKDDSVTIEVYVEPPSMAQQVHSRDGILNWVIRECKRRQSFENRALVSFQESPYFYTGPNGYRVQARLALNGSGKGPSVMIDFLQGEYDDDLPKPFPHRTTVTLSNPKDPRRFVSKTIGCYDHKTQYVVHVCKAKELANLIEGDTLYVRVEMVKANR